MLGWVANSAVITAVSQILPIYPFRHVVLYFLDSSWVVGQRVDNGCDMQDFRTQHFIAGLRLS